MDLERQFIERTDFSAARRGYDPEEVDRHLREIAVAVEELKRSGAAAGASSVAAQAAERVRSIVEAAELSAGAIETNAQAEADRLTGNAEREARDTRASASAEAAQAREQAESDAAGHIERVQDATAKMLARADGVEGELNGLVDELRSTVVSLVERVRAGAGTLGSELDEIRAGLAEVRPPEPVAPTDLTQASSLAEEPAEGTAEAAYEAYDEGAVEAGAYEREEDLGEEPELAEEEAQDELGYVAEEGQATVEHEAAEEAAYEEPAAAPSDGGEGAEGARLIALNMALNGTPREETARYLEENFDLEDQDAILDEVYARAGG